MSEKSKGDTSSSSTVPVPSRVVKNPLLSASVTGLAFEDFPNKPLLLPAAPPIVNVAPVAPPVLGLGLLSREPKSLVTVGQTSDTDHDESLSEINLNSNAEENQPAQIDTNSNTLLEQNTNTDSILSQAASSFSALPSVASSVFSTFSKRIYSTTSSRERTPVSEEQDVNANPISELDIQPAYTQQQHQQHHQHSYSAPPQQFGATAEVPPYIIPPTQGVFNNNIGAPPTASTQSQFSNQELPPEPPKLYTPAEIPNLKAANAAAPPPPCGQNTYRLTAKKKIYAPIPGFSETTNQNQVAPVLDTSAISAPIAGPINAQTQSSSYGFPQPTDLYDQNQTPLRVEERKVGLFSISNLVPTGVFQNISGLVQSAAGTIAQTVAPDTTLQSTFTSQQQTQQQQLQESSSFDINFQSSTSNDAPLSYDFYSGLPSQKVSAAPYPTEAQQIQVGLPALPTQSNSLAHSESLNLTETQNLTENPIVPVSTQLGFDQLLNDSNSQSILPSAQLGENTVEKSNSGASYILSGTEGPVSSETLEKSLPLIASTAVDSPSALTATTSAPILSPGIKSIGSPGPAVAPAQIPLYDPIRPPTQPANTNIFSNNSSFPIRPPSQPVPNIFTAPIRPPTQPVPSGFFDPIRPPTQPISAATNFATPSGFFDPLRPPSQPLPETSSILPPEGFSAPIRPPSQPNSAATSIFPPNTFSAPIRPSSHPYSATNSATNIFQPIQPSLQPTPIASVSPAPSSFSAPIRPPTQPVSVTPLNSSPANFFAPIGPSSQTSFDPIRPPTQPAGSVNFAPNIISAPIRPPTQPSPVAATPVNFFDPTRPPSKGSALDPAQQLPQSTTQQVSTSIANHIYPTPPLSNQVPPTSIGQPPAASGPSSFRLQKGTRLYKNPLTSAETVPAPQISSALQQTTFVQPPTVAPQSIFNPLASTVAPVEQSPALFVPETLPVKEFQEAHLVDRKISNISHSEHSTAQFSKEPEISEPIGFFDPNSTSLAELNTQNSLLPNTELDLKTSEQLTQIQNNFQQQEIKLPTPADLFISQPPKPDVETESIHTTPSSFEVIDNSEVANINVDEPQLKLQQNQDNPVLTEDKKDSTVDETLCSQAQHQIKELNDDTIAASQGANFLPPPPQLTGVHGFANPYRKEHTASHIATGTQPSLANFFTPIESDTSNDFSFFSKAVEPIQPSAAAGFSEPSLISENSSTTAPSLFQLQTPNAPTPTPQPTPSASPKPTTTSTTVPTPITDSSYFDPALFPQLPPQTHVAPPPLFKEPPKNNIDSNLVQQSTIAPPIGFDNLIASTEIDCTSNVDNTTSLKSQESTTQQPSKFHSVKNFFNQPSNSSNFETSAAAAKELVHNLPNSTSFFDSFSSAAVPTNPVQSSLIQTSPNKQQQTNEDQRIQNFFNNPPPQELGGNISDLNYNIVHGGLAVKNLQTRSLTPASILVEPPSSSCSEFSELNTSSLGQQRQIVAIENPNKTSVEEETKAQASAETSASQSTSDNLSKVETIEDLRKHYKDLPEEVLEELRMANLLTGEKGAAIAPPATISTYSPAVKHWFYKRENCNKIYWTPFSHYDSAILETAHVMGDNSQNIVAVEGGRFDVNIQDRIKTPVYWEGKPIEVRRCSWFYKGSDSRYVPYEEETADRLEAEYKLATEKDEWHKKIIISMGEQVVFHGPTVIVHFQQQQNIDAWGGSSQTTTRPRVVKRDLDDFTIEQGESQRVDHLLLMVHGIGSVCDLKMRSVEEVVDDFRSIAQQLVSSHYKNSTEMGLVGRVEILPISWHSHLHSTEMGIDEKLKSITLESIPKLRNFANDTLLDVLFYTSPRYCQKIMNTVASSMNAVYVKYRQRHPDFSGGVSVAGHSLGSLILFDMLCNQKPIKEFEEENMENPDQQFPAVPSTYLSTVSSDDVTKEASYTTGVAGTGQPFIHYEQLLFHPKKFFAIGSPIGVFVTIRGIDKLGLDFRLPTCTGFYNIFHPFDPIAYRIEALINPDMTGIRPVLIPHHKGRKRMHLELRETMTRVGADLKQRFMDTFKNTLDSVNFLGTSTGLLGGSKENEVKFQNEAMEKEVDKVLKMQSDMEQAEDEHLLSDEHKMQSQARPRTDSTSTSFSDDIVEVDFPLGKLNDSKRIDYVLQEAPLEFINEYLFALSSHVGYWESEDTILFVMKEIYSGLGVSPDSQVPQQSMKIERPSSQNTQHDQVTTPT